MATEDITQTPTMKGAPPRKLKRVGEGAQSIVSPRANPPLLKTHLVSGLYLVATPIGNLDDFSARAQKTLLAADLILGEDTRVTRKLMGLFGITGQVERCDEATTTQGIARACAVLAQGGCVAFCADAGTPGVSDPGERLAQGVMAAGYAVFAIPGPCAAITALTISGLPSTQFMFAGFAPAKAGARSRFFSDLVSIKATIIFYETGPRLQASLIAMQASFGDRMACVARELTKMYEEVRRGRLSDLITHYDKAGQPKGEIVVVLEGASDAQPAIEPEDLDAMILAALTTTHLKDAANAISAQTGLPKRDIYARGLALGKKAKS